MNKNPWFLAILLPVYLLFSTSTMADLILTEGGATGQWFNPERDGEGLFVEIVESGEGARSLAMSWFTYDESGEQMWLTGIAALDENATTVSVSVSVTSGPIFGPDYDKDDLISEFWGTIDLRFQTCEQGNMSYTSSIGFGSGSIALTRLTNVVAVNCVEPPVETAPVKPGKWIGPGVCLYVAEDGLSITSEGSTCSGGHAFKATVPGIPVGGGLDCSVSVICPDTYAIYPTDNVEPNPAFDCKDLAGIASGMFFETEGGAPSVNGSVYDRSDGNGCAGVWLANPEG